jgi:hypothetical protein
VKGLTGHAADGQIARFSPAETILVERNVIAGYLRIRTFMAFEVSVEPREC